MTEKRTFKEFHSTYGAYLLRTPTAKFNLGDFVDKETKFWIDVENESIVDELDFESDKRKEYRNYLEATELVDANFPEISFEKEFLLDMKLTIPSKVDAGLKIDNSKIVKFEFGQIKARVMDNSGQLEIRKIIEDQFKEDWNEDKRDFKREIGKPNKTYIVEELFYADQVKVTVEKEFELDASAKAKIENVEDVELKAGVDAAGNHEYSFSGTASVPFAAKVIRLSDL